MTPQTLPLRPQPFPPAPPPIRAPAAVFRNPLVRSDAADPWIAYRNGFYYFTFTAGNHIEIWKSRTLAGLDNGAKKTVWTKPATGPDSGDVWAPELHFLRGKWYIYFTATDENSPRRDDLRRQFVLESLTDDPQGAYRERGSLSVPGSDDYMIDGTVCEVRGKLYCLWSGRASEQNHDQRIFIAPMSDPATISGARVMLSAPTYQWERVGWPVNEGPEVLTHGKKTFVTYSASGGTTMRYCLGLLENDGSDLLDARAWHKADHPVFSTYTGADGAVYAPGHNGFFRSPDNKQDWIVYHGKDAPIDGWGGRKARAQPIAWGKDGMPDFGHPMPASVSLAKPSGEKR